MRNCPDRNSGLRHEIALYDRLRYDHEAMQHLTFMLVPGFSAMAFFSSLEPLRVANRLAGQSLFRWSIHSPQGDHALASNDMQIRCDGPLPEVADTMVVCAGFGPLDHVRPDLLGKVRRSWRAGAQVGAIDTGAFVLAEAGILGSDTITLHWEAADEFRRRYPRIPVSTEIYERHARLFTCAGGTAAMDMMLDTIAAAHGLELATAVSQQLMHERIRPASAQQRASLAEQAEAAGPQVRHVIAAMERAIGDALPLEEILVQTGISRRQAERLFTAQMNISV